MNNRFNPSHFNNVAKLAVALSGMGGLCFGLELANKANTTLNAWFETNGGNSISSSIWGIKRIREEWFYMCLGIVGYVVGTVTTQYILYPIAAINSGSIAAATITMGAIPGIRSI